MMAEKRRRYPEECEREASRLVAEQGYGVSGAARTRGINAHLLGRWQRELDTKGRARFLVRAERPQSRTRGSDSATSISGGAWGVTC
jgi:transposase-like protein